MNSVRIFKIVVVLLLQSTNFCEGEKILFFFGGGSYSHKNSAWSWASELADRGHQVTFLSPHDKKPTDNSKINDLSSTTLRDLMSKSYDVDRFQSRKDGTEQNILKSYSKISIDICETTLLKSQDDPVLQNLIQNGSFDLVVVNNIFGECGFLFANRYKAKTVLYDASVPLPWFYDIYGFQAETSWIPDILIKYDNIPLSFVDRVKNTLWPLYWSWDRQTNMYPAFERIMKEAFDLTDVPAFLDLERNASVLIINSYPATDFAHTLPPFAVQVGGIQTWLPEKEIPTIYQDFMDSAGESGVVFISFGSTVRLEKVPVQYINIFFNLIKKYKDVRFLLKWKGPLPKGFESGLDNLLVSDWLPQRELLRHPKLRAFISHGGLNSIQEATYYGVPMIVLPLFADQDYNAYRVEAQKVGFRLEIRDLTFEMMDDAVYRILSDPQYKKNMETKSEIFRDRPQSPLDTVVYWTEFVLKHNDVSSLKPMNANLNWYQRRLLDIYVFYAAVLILIVSILCVIIVKCVNALFTGNASPKQKRS